MVVTRLLLWHLSVHQRRTQFRLWNRDFHSQLLQQSRSMNSTLESGFFVPNFRNRAERLLRLWNRDVHSQLPQHVRQTNLTLGLGGSIQKFATTSINHLDFGIGILIPNSSQRSRNKFRLWTRDFNSRFLQQRRKNISTLESGCPFQILVTRPKHHFDFGIVILRSQFS